MNLKIVSLAFSFVLLVSSSAVAQRRAIPAPNYDGPSRQNEGMPDTYPDGPPIQRDGDERRREEIDPKSKIQRRERDSQFENPYGGGEVNPGNIPPVEGIYQDPDGEIRIR
jgi:hypothetical protein